LGGTSSTTVTTRRFSTSSPRKAHSLIMKGQMNLKANYRFVRTDQSNDQKRVIKGQGGKKVWIEKE